jgi:hypothetical protein
VNRDGHEVDNPLNDVRVNSSRTIRAADSRQDEWSWKGWGKLHGDEEGIKERRLMQANVSEVLHLCFTKRTIE